MFPSRHASLNKITCLLLNTFSTVSMSWYLSLRIRPSFMHCSAFLIWLWDTSREVMPWNDWTSSCFQWSPLGGRWLRSISDSPSSGRIMGWDSYTSSIMQVANTIALFSECQDAWLRGYHAGSGYYHNSGLTVKTYWLKMGHLLVPWEFSQYNMLVDKYNVLVFYGSSIHTVGDYVKYSTCQCSP